MKRNIFLLQIYKQTKIILLVFSLLILNSVNSNYVYGQSIDNIVSNFNTCDTSQISQIAGKSKIIGIGESAHGSGSIIQLRSEIIKNLILNHGFKNIVLESSFWGTQKLNEFVRNEYVADTSQAFISMGVGVWINKEMLDFLTWVREYNSNKVDSLKVSLFGCDVWGSWDLIQTSKYFRNNTWVLSNLSKESINTLDSIANIKGWCSKSIGKKAIVRLHNELLLKCTTNVFNTIEENYFAQLVGLAISNINKRGGYRSSVFRDKIMANTILYLTKQKPDEKFVLIAHNEHVVKSRNSTFLKPMGKHLYKEFGENYQAVAITIINGSIQTYNKETRKIETVSVRAPIAKSVEAISEGLVIDMGFIDLTANRHNSVLKKKIKMRSIGGSYSERHINYSRQKLYKGFNSLIVIRESNAPRFIYRAK